MSGEEMACTFEITGKEGNEISNLQPHILTEQAAIFSSIKWALIVGVVALFIFNFINIYHLLICVAALLILLSRWSFNYTLVNERYVFDDEKILGSVTVTVSEKQISIYKHDRLRPSIFEWEDLKEVFELDQFLVLKFKRMSSFCFPVSKIHPEIVATLKGKGFSKVQ